MRIDMGFNNQAEIKKHRVFAIVLVFLLAISSVAAQDTTMSVYTRRKPSFELQAGFQSKYFDVTINFFGGCPIAGGLGALCFGLNFNTISTGPVVGLQYTGPFIMSFKIDFVSGYMFKDKTFNTYFNPRIGIHFKRRIFLYYGYCFNLYKTNSIENFKGHNFNLAYLLAL